MAALEPVVDPLIRQYRQWQEQLTTARARHDTPAEQAAQDALNALVALIDDKFGEGE